VALRYDVNANLVFTCLRDLRFADSGAEVAPFLPVEIVNEPGLRPASSSAQVGSRSSSRRAPDADRRQLRSRGARPAAAGHVVVILAPSGTTVWLRAGATNVRKGFATLAAHPRQRSGKIRSPGISWCSGNAGAIW
jgi:hypothetical protein